MMALPLNAMEPMNASAKPVAILFLAARDGSDWAGGTLFIYFWEHSAEDASLCAGTAPATGIAAAPCDALVGRTRVQCDTMAAIGAIDPVRGRHRHRRWPRSAVSAYGTANAPHLIGEQAARQGHSPGGRRNVQAPRNHQERHPQHARVVRTMRRTMQRRREHRINCLCEKPGDAGV
ncbi:hypothetical protein D3C71_1418310 [compost metagenome]